jgi:hypothetical protein
MQIAEVKVCDLEYFPKYIESLGKSRANLRKALNGVMLQICYVYKRTKWIKLFSIYESMLNNTGWTNNY